MNDNSDTTQPVIARAPSMELSGFDEPEDQRDGVVDGEKENFKSMKSK